METLQDIAALCVQRRPILKLEIASTDNVDFLLDGLWMLAIPYDTDHP